MTLHKKLCESVKMVQERMKMYYNKKRSEGPDLKKRDKVWLLHKNFKNWWLSKKLNYVKLELFRISAKISNFIYKLDLLAKMKIYSVQHVAILKPAYGDVKSLLYKMETYNGQKKTNGMFKRLWITKKINKQL